MVIFLIFDKSFSNRSKAWFPLDRNGILKSCDSGCFWFNVERLIKNENKNLTEISSDLQPKRFLS